MESSRCEIVAAILELSLQSVCTEPTSHPPTFKLPVLTRASSTVSLHRAYFLPYNLQPSGRHSILTMPFTLYSSVDEWEASALANAPSQEHQHLAQALKDVLSGVTTPAEGASRIASVVNPSSDPYPLYLWTIMRITSAAEGFSEDVVL
ncbi:hypothetical protein MPH_11918 [Macrophomina phaseolina MS6]|uniref:Uncharacterized protein n=1 Tax=Macrophomina phaseolina (strain MS6) TaxID=1126212 RepID=K2QLZ2_MACPH|nr:hypothetical protein MPH_11918 [Macrophomina phaseolina MS6]